MNDDLGFPFLVGRIRAFVASSEIVDRDGFPFLVGRIRACEADIKLTIRPRGFPFLVGRIRARKISALPPRDAGFHSL